MTLNPAEFQVEQLKLFFLAFVRVLTMMIVFPIFGSQNVPWQLKAVFSFLFAIVLFPILHTKGISVPSEMIPFFLMVIKEAIVGLVLGFAASLIFTGVSMAGNIIDNQVGFTMVNTIDPLTLSSTAILGQFQIVIFTIVFLCLDGHQFLVSAMAKSFDKIPITGLDFQAGRLAEAFTYLTGNIFDIAIRLSAPILVIILLATVASGVLSRTVPQLNMFVIDLPVRVGAGLVGLAVSLPIVYYVFEKTYAQLQDNIYKLLMLMA